MYYSCYCSWFCDCFGVPVVVVLVSAIVVVAGELVVVADEVVVVVLLVSLVVVVDVVDKVAVLVVPVSNHWQTCATRTNDCKKCTSLIAR